MPKVIMRHQLTGMRNRCAWPAPGESLVVSDDEARMLLHHRHAELADDAAEVDTEVDTDDAAEVDTDDDLESCTVAELRKAASARGLSTAGAKAALVARLRGD